MNINEHRVREFAHQIWESEGRPEGQAGRHWEMACKLAATEDDYQEQEQAPQHTTVLHNDLDIINKPKKAKTRALKKTEAANEAGLKDTSVERMAPSDINSEAPERSSRKTKKMADTAEPKSAPKKVSFAKNEGTKNGRSKKAELLKEVVDTDLSGPVTFTSTP